MKLDIFDIEKLVSINNLKEVKSAYIFAADGSPDSEGIFSYEIFGRVGSEDREINFGYIDLKRKFLHPLVYNAIYQMFRNLPFVIAGDKWCVIDPKTNGVKIVPYGTDGAGTGVDFFYDNWEKINWNTNDSSTREKKENLFNTMKKEEVFWSKYPIIPALYRDINLHNKVSGKVDMDEINSMYIKLINNVNSELITFTGMYNIQSSVQNTIVDIHNYLTKKNSGKRGTIHQAIMGKTVDYAITSVISAPRFNSEKFTEQLIPYNHIGIPLYNVCAMFYPLIIKALEDIFFAYDQDEYFTAFSYAGEVIDSRKAGIHDKISTAGIEKLVSSYIKDKTKSIRTARFSFDGDLGRYESMEKQLGRPFTVTDLLYQVCIDVVFNKHVLSTRFPITGAESQIVNRIKILTTEKTVDLSREGDDTLSTEYIKTYPYFPTYTDKDGNVHIDEKKIKWLDTVIPNNSVLAGMGGDYDGDTFRLIGLFEDDSNLEAKRLMQAPMNYVDAGGNLMRSVARESGLSLYMLTKD